MSTGHESTPNPNALPSSYLSWSCSLMYPVPFPSGSCSWSPYQLGKPSPPKPDCNPVPNPKGPGSAQLGMPGKRSPQGWGA